MTRFDRVSYPEGDVVSRLDESIRYLRGVGPRRAEALERLGIRTLEDLLLHVPRRYFDRSRLVPLRELAPGMMACVRARVESLQVRPGWHGRRSVVATVADDTAQLRVVWFTAWTRDQLPPGCEVILAGPVTAGRGRLEMRQPEFERIDADSQSWLHGGRIVPLYPATRGVTQKWLRSMAHAALAAVGDEVPEILPDSVRGDALPRAAAFRALHFPDSMPAAAGALERFKFEEFFFLQLLLLRRRALARARRDGVAMLASRSLHRRYLESLPFALTGGQERVLGEIIHDLESGAWMQRLVLGDVGAGKTVLAAAALFMAAGNGWQGVLMAPTEALALQHAERFVGPCVALGVRLGVLVGSRPERDKEEVRARLASGDVDVVIGTHALVQENVRCKHLGLVVVDEQQRFGVLQRGALVRGAHRPHVLALSATPIPRSLALTLFGDLDVSRLDEKPPGRQPVRTRLVPEERDADLWKFVRSEVAAGRQGYVVLPIIDESESLELRAATEEYARLRAGPLVGLTIGLLHGRLPAAERDGLLQAFRRGALAVLVCTSVVEVGLDVANATLMIIHHPERFGLAQLHQLRGRVGRGAEVSYCFLLPGRDGTEAAQERLRRFARTDDGFEIAELDLELRGPGDLIGTRQHGLPDLRVADVARDLPVLLAARDAAAAILAADPDLAAPAHAAARLHLESHYSEHTAWADIG